jgi:hypothetical protein
MSPDAYGFISYGQACADPASCALCTRLDGKPTACSPHSALIKTEEAGDLHGQRSHYKCHICGTEWTRLIKNSAMSGRAEYWQARSHAVTDDACAADTR